MIPAYLFGMDSFQFFSFYHGKVGQPETSHAVYGNGLHGNFPWLNRIINPPSTTRYLSRVCVCVCVCLCVCVCAHDGVNNLSLNKLQKAAHAFIQAVEMNTPWKNYCTAWSDFPGLDLIIALHDIIWIWLSLTYIIYIYIYSVLIWVLMVMGNCHGYET